MFIAIDGPDGSGKTTISHMLVESLSEKYKCDAIYTTEPTDSDLGKKIRSILKEGSAQETAKLTDYFILDRKAHVDLIEHHLQENKIVVCDRYKYSTVVYQQLQGEGPGRLIELNKPFLKPDYAFILQIKSVDTLLEHITNRGTNKDLFETKSTLKKVIDLYSQMINYFPDENIHYINADQDLNSVVRQIMDKL